jgi:dCMP deaminase
MPTSKENDSLYMGIAILHSNLSKARRAKVGACLVTTHGVVLGGYNGTPRGMDNDCETSIKTYTIGSNKPYEILTTKPEVIHAETNAVLKAAREGVSTQDAKVYVTLSPCVPCAAMLINAGISKLVYKDLYRDDSGVQLLLRVGIQVEQLKE